MKRSERQNLKRGGKEGGRERGRAVIAVAIAFGLVEGRARLLLSSRCQRNEC